METLIIIATGILGLIVGSFLNVIVLRMNTGYGISGRSRCFSCNKTLRWYELIPIMSYVIQRGKCRHCASPISPQYFLVELITGILFAVVAWAINPIVTPITFVLWLLLTSIGMVIAVYDIRHQVIAERPLIIFLAVCIALGMHGIGFLLVPLPFLVLWVISKGKWIGFGDVELMACIGMLLGVVLGAGAVVLSFWIACLVILPWYGIQKLRKKNVSHKVPFGPFLLVATYIVGLFGFSLFDWILTLIQ